MPEESDPGRPIAYAALAAGTPVYDRDGQRAGTVKRVLAVEEEDVFDGLVIDTDHGTRFIDAPEVGHLAEHRCDLKLSSAELAARPHHEDSPPVYEARAPTGGLKDLWRRITLRRLWRRD
jgi:hypothetical protein